jgi:hypothetical protein
MDIDIYHPFSMVGMGEINHLSVGPKSEGGHLSAYKTLRWSLIELQDISELPREPLLKAGLVFTDTSEIRVTANSSVGIDLQSGSVAEVVLPITSLQAAQTFQSRQLGRKRLDRRQFNQFRFHNR